MKQKLFYNLAIICLLTLSMTLFAQNAPINFEPGGTGSDWTWETFENDDNPPLEVIENPDMTGANPSEMVAKFTARATGMPWAGTLTSGIGEFTFDETNCTIKIMVWKSVISDVGIKFEYDGASSGDIKVANTLVNQWEELTFDFSGKIGETNNLLAVFPDFTERSEENVVYFDNITFSEQIISDVGPEMPAPAPTYHQSNVISLFSDVYEDVYVDTWSAVWDLADVTDDSVMGNYMKKYTNLSYAGIEFTSETIDASAMTHFHMDIWTPDPVNDPANFEVKLVDFGADGVYGNGDDSEHALFFNDLTFPAMVTEQWISMDLPLSDFTNLLSTEHLAQLIIAGEPNTVFVDNVYFHNGQAGWLVDLDVMDAGGIENSDVVTFGAHPNATEGVDVMLGEEELPPLPPAGAFDTRFVLPVSPPVSSLIDIRPEADMTEWELYFQPGNGGFPMTLSWDSASLPDGQFRIVDPFGGSLVDIDMKAQNSLEVTNTSITTLLVKYTTSIMSEVNVDGGWNLISVPVMASDMTKDVLFPTSVSNAFLFNDGYQVAETLENGAGYWLKFDAPEMIAHQGAPVTDDIPLAEGWNIFGVYDQEVAVADLVTEPAGIFASSFFGFDGSYTSTDMLMPGKGYWIKTSAPGMILHNTAPSKKSPVVLPQVNSNWTKLTVSDNAYNSFNLYLAQNISAGTYGLPPAPPAGAFDVRFKSGNYVESAGTENVVNISTLDYPVTISANNGDLTIVYLSNGSSVQETLADGNSVTITDENVTSFRVLESLEVTSYALEQNYPNPFNPATSIKFAIPVKSDVVLEVYNLLGQKVATLVNSTLEAGNHQVEFNANNLSSGVYLYSLRAGDFSKTAKMMLLK